MHWSTQGTGSTTANDNNFKENISTDDVLFLKPYEATKLLQAPAMESEMTPLPFFQAFWGFHVVLCRGVTLILHRWTDWPMLILHRPDLFAPKLTGVSQRLRRSFRVQRKLAWDSGDPYQLECRRRET